MALVMAHVDLAKAEAGQIAGEVGRVAALGALAIALVIFAVFLVVIGTSLWLGEWLLGSMGWGVLHGFLLFVSVAMAAVLNALGIAPQRLGGAFLVSLVVGVVVGVVLGLGLLNQLYASVGPMQYRAIAQLLCEVKLLPRDVMARLNVSAQEVAAVVNDLILRGVASLRR